LITLSITDTVSVDDEVGRELTVVVFGEGFDRLFDGILHVVLNDLLTFLLDEVVTVVLTHVLVDTC